ncbi:protein MB21D2-like [Gymnodraco acuticeps]|uniref:Protein MB21D2-like n=1 Tax=Gymnodraco acuticeps TaxID=8218 RepID=A0A6P8V2K0_GYMAC|nr:protein MB21D2-like [Gymnodraco acuticeps]
MFPPGAAKKSLSSCRELISTCSLQVQLKKSLSSCRVQLKKSLSSCRVTHIHMFPPGAAEEEPLLLQSAAEEEPSSCRGVTHIHMFPPGAATKASPPAEVQLKKSLSSCRVQLKKSLSSCRVQLKKSLSSCRVQLKKSLSSCRVTHIHMFPPGAAEEEPLLMQKLISTCSLQVQLKKCISSSLMQAYQACKAILIKLLSRPKALSPYHLRSVMLWACDRLPASFLLQEHFSACFLLGLIDDLQHCLLNKMCPNYFIPQCNMLETLSDEAAMLHARKLSSVRSDPAEHLRSTIEHAKAANRMTEELQWRGGSQSVPQSDSAADSPPDDRLAKKLQQLVTENPGKSISVFINPDDVTRPHFRIDDKFF